MTVMAPQRHRAAAKKPLWIIMLLSMVCFVLIGAYVYPPRRYSQCYLFGSSVCTPFKDWLPTMGRRERTDEEVISSVVLRDILAMPVPVSKNPKIALMFLTPGSLPFEKLWEKFLEVVWGLISMVDAEKRLLANALEDVDNQIFVLLSDSCVPLHSFDYVYNYLMGTNVSFIDCFKDPGPHGSGRYSVEMFPEIDQRDFRKGAQAIDENFHVTSDDKKLVMQKPCLWNGSKRPCYLFARKFDPEALENLLEQFTSYTSV
ncbi:hypothetical protein PR202_gb28122 [Eleusine coracana subsp. coracana]|uniref:Core-2/I-branching beta-16-N-acetylglucosaminyltransferase family protein n=1 Tax=Eleusine coracana subsp. coracana TaxID=191504 RepID=A0AAV5FTM0_ELECO|nr:hypothetical protein PR202_gb28122 [Eleusine coracana subsp. coracana]